MLTVYGVSAGKYEHTESGIERNCKYSEFFFSLPEAEAALKTCNDYPWYEIEKLTYGLIDQEVMEVQ